MGRLLPKFFVHVGVQAAAAIFTILGWGGGVGARLGLGQRLAFAGTTHSGYDRSLQICFLRRFRCVNLKR